MSAMFVNLDTIPHGEHLYTIFVTNQPVDTPRTLRFVDEIDVQAKTNLTPVQIIKTVDLEKEGYDRCRVVGIADASIGEVLIERWEGVEL